MNAKPFRCVFPFLACALGLLLMPDAASAQDGGSFLQANVIYEFVADRARMIQVSLVFVVVGCALLWWKK
jgi:hypothetical protein